MKTHIERVQLGRLAFLKKNARYMKNETFKRLVENIRKDGELTSVPLVYPQEDETLLVLSGNHRSRAAMEAGIEEADVMVIDEELTRAEQVALQLSHNAIEGEDDPAILKELWDEIDDVDLKMYAGLDDKTLQEMEKVDVPSLHEVSLDFRTASFVFLPEEIGRIDKAFEDAKAFLEKGGDAYLASLIDFDRMLDALAKTGSAWGIRNSATALMLVLDVFERNLLELKEGWDAGDGEIKHDGWVPLASITGTDDIPAAAASVIDAAVCRMVDSGQVSGRSRWRALEMWAADYLGSA